MTLLVVNGYTVKISRGDTYSITVKIDGELQEGAQAVAAIAKKAGATPIWQKTVSIEDNVAVFELTPTETDIAAGSYFWDVRIIMADGAVKTVFTPASFQILEVVADA